MADLIEKAPADPPATPPATPPADAPPPGADPPPAGEAPPTADGKEPPKARPPVDLDARLEEVLAESRRVAELDKQVAARKKALDDLEAAWKPKATIDEHLKKGDRKAAVKALLDGKLDEGLLFELAEELAAAGDAAQPKPAAPPPSIEEQVAAILAAREKAAEEKRLADEKAKQEADAKAAQEQMNTFLTNSATFLKANLDQFPFIKAWGCDSDRYTQLLLEHAEKHHVLPEPQALLQVMEDEHRAKWAKSPYAPQQPPPIEDLDAHVAAAYQRNRPPPSAEQPPARPKTALELAREELQAYDRQQAERLRYHQGG